MLSHVVRRVAAAVPTLFVIIVLAFFLMRLAPGGPFDAERPVDPETLQTLRRIYRLDLPLYPQFGLFFWSLLKGDLGPSFHWRDFSVNDLFARAFPVSFRLGCEALVLALVLGMGFGLVDR